MDSPQRPLPFLATYGQRAVSFQSTFTTLISVLPLFTLMIPTLLPRMARKVGSTSTIFASLLSTCPLRLSFFGGYAGFSRATLLHEQIAALFNSPPFPPVTFPPKTPYLPVPLPFPQPIRRLDIRGWHRWRFGFFVWPFYWVREDPRILHFTVKWHELNAA